MLKYIRVIESAEDDAEAHVYDAHYHRHLHLVRVQECEAVGRQVPYLYNKTTTNDFALSDRSIESTMFK